MTRETKPAADSTANYRRPSERAARFVLGVTGWVRDIFTSTTITTPRGQVFQHRGNPLPPGRELRFHNILLVEDNPDVSREFVDTINRYYAFGSVRIFAAYAFDAAVSFFDNEDIDLVIMDLDLDDEDGDGLSLTGRFLSQRPDLTILANSSSMISNRKLTGAGATGVLEKKKEKLAGWLLENDPGGGAG